MVYVSEDRDTKSYTKSYTSLASATLFVSVGTSCEGEEGYASLASSVSPGNMSLIGVVMPASAFSGPAFGSMSASFFVSVRVSGVTTVCEQVSTGGWVSPIYTMLSYHMFVGSSVFDNELFVYLGHDAELFGGQVRARRVCWCLAWRYWRF